MLVLVVILFLSGLLLTGGLASIANMMDARSAVMFQAVHIGTALTACAAVSCIDYGRAARFSSVGCVILSALFLLAIFQELYGYVRIGMTAFSAAALSPLYLLLFAGA